MTQRDRDRLVVLKKAQKRLITQSQAAKAPAFEGRLHSPAEPILNPRRFTSLLCIMKNDDCSIAK
jgi:hypothetical protein